MPKWLPPRDASGRFLKKASKQSTSTPDCTHEPEASTSQSVSHDSSIESPSPIIAAASRSPLIFPPPTRHHILGSFSPLTDSPSDSPVSTSNLVTRQSSLLVSPSSVSVPDSRTPLLISLPESVVSQASSTAWDPSAPDTNLNLEPDSTSSSSSSSSAASSQTVPVAPRTSSAIFQVNFRASQFLSSCPDPLSASSSVSTSSTSSLSAASSAPSQSLASSQNQTQQLPSTALPSSSLVFAPVAPTTVSTSTQTVPPPPPAVPAPPPAPPAHPPVAPAVPAIVPAMATNPAAGPSAMPYAKDNKAPYFSACLGDILDDFLREYEELATTCTLTDQQKVEPIL